MIYCSSIHIVVLGWFTDAELSQVLTGKTLIQAKDMKEIPAKCLDETVSLHRVRKYFHAKAWESLLTRVEHRKQNPEWYCAVCHHELGSEESVGCDACLEWYHFKCAGLSHKPKRKVWICRQCHKKL